MVPGLPVFFAAEPGSLFSAAREIAGGVANKRERASAGRRLANPGKAGEEGVLDTVAGTLEQRAANEKRRT
jgi:hypothetical protein